MNRTISFLLFLVVLASNILSSELGWLPGVYITKPLLIPLLVWMLVGAARDRVKWVWFALFFSWVGDILLMLPYDLFIFGLASFLIAHLFYIRHFWGVWDRRATPLKWLYVIPVLFWLGLLFSVLLPVLGDLRVPVIGYGIVISAMLLIALHTGRLGYQIGAALFVLSDSILAVNKFHTPLPVAGLLVMGTYGLAQYYIVKTSRM